jgi:hypothetical protein
MSDLTLLDYRAETVSHLFSSETGILTRNALSVTDGLPVAGYASRKRIGVFHFKIITVAVFCEGSSLMLWIPSKKINLSSDAVCGVVRLIAPFVREFRLMQGERVLYSCSYWHSGGRVWPDDGDIFSLIKRITASPEAIEKTHRIWTARLENGSANALGTLGQPKQKLTP